MIIENNQLWQSLPVGAAIFDEQFSMLDANFRLCDILKCSAEKLKNRGWMDFVDENVDFAGLVERRSETEMRQFKDANGHRLWILIRLGVIANSKRGKIFYQVIFQDITEIHKREIEALQFQSSFDNELQLARRIQRHINNYILDFIDTRKFRFEFQNSFIPSHHLSGDMINVYTINRRYSAVFIGDGRGHGLPAALYSGLIYSYLNILAMQVNSGENSLAELIRSINRIAYSDFKKGSDYYFFSGVFLLIDGNEGEVQVVNAGHPHPVCFLDGQICRFETSGPLIGVNAAAQYSSQKIVLKGGEIFLFFTDGLTELANHQNQFFGEEKIVEYFEEFINQDENFENILSDLLERLNTFREDAEVEDDISMLAMRVSLRLGLT